ncbi:MAG: undecaprenyldiphospho-muramoylpentapeptide beta-N-acetylglucosaminyltransferase [Bacteroidales bacterium]
MQHKEHKTKILISGGGTGGHVFPAIAIAEALKSKLHNAEFLFVGAKGRMEMEKVPAAGYQIEAIPIAGFQRRWTLKNLSFFFKLIISLIKARRIIRNFAPDIVIGVGGYASGPVLYVASRRKIPTLIQEQNSYPGITNRILARSVDRVCVAYDNMQRFFPKEKTYVTGNPVRQNVIKMVVDREEATKYFGLNPNRRIVLAMGGSLGARSVNQGIHNALEQFREKEIQVIWQTGKQYIEQAQQAVNKEYTNMVYVTDFISRMDLAYAAADLVVSRAGAIAISEIQAVQKPAIFVPSPNVAENHQHKNAMALVNYHAAKLVEDKDAAQNLGKEIDSLINNDKELSKLNDNIARLAKTDAANTIASVVIDMINNK